MNIKLIVEFLIIVTDNPSINYWNIQFLSCYDATVDA